MIAYIEGKLVQRETTFVIVEAGGIGYYIKVSLNTSSALAGKTTCRIQTHLQIREDAHTLYGFMDYEEKRVFLELINVSGIGANTAMIMLSSLSTREIIEAIVQEDVSIIQSVKGIGKKTAERLILELKDKIKKTYEELALTFPEMSSEGIDFQKVKSEALEALVALGIPKVMAEKNVSAIIKKQGTSLTLEELIKLALKA
jgi:Holliday junction DNA helicase RuvA